MWNINGSEIIVKCIFLTYYNLYIGTLILFILFTTQSFNRKTINLILKFFNIVEILLY